MALLRSKVRSIRRRAAADFTSGFEALERRVLLTSVHINYPDFSSTAGLTANGFGSTAANSNGQLVMTDSQMNEARSVYYNTPVLCDGFITHFSYRVDPTTGPADGVAFALQENGLNALGAVGGSLGYQTYGSSNVGVGVGFHIFDGGRYELFNGNRAVAYDSMPFSMSNGDTYDITITYDGTTLTSTITDPSNSANTYTQSTAIDLQSELGADTAYVGLTAATGGSVSTQRILNWDYTGTDPLGVTIPAASPGVVTAKSTALSVAAIDSTSGGALTYAWSIAHKPSGAADPTFDDNNSGTADDTTANFFKAGTYIFNASATNANGLTDSSQVTITVQQTATAVRVTPHAQRIVHHTTQSCTATVTDQFGHPMRTQPTIVWSLLHGAGTIDSSTGLFTAGSTKGHILIEASDALDALTGTIGATVV